MQCMSKQLKILPNLISSSNLVSPLGFISNSLSLLPSWFLIELESSVSLFLSLWSEDADPLSEALHICILPTLIIRGQSRRRRHKVCWIRQSVFLGKRLPAAVIALVGDVTFAHLTFQLPQVQPCLIVLSKGSK